jgi:outer membrane protein assembly factor BamB
VLMTVDGTKMVVTPAMGLLAGVELSDGKALWQTKIGAGGKDYASNYSTPLIDKEMVYYSLSAGRKGAGSFVALKIAKSDGGFKATEVWKKPYAAADYHTPVLKDGMIFGVNKDRSYFCMDAKTGDKLWTDTAEHGQCGSIIDGGSVLLSLTSDKNLVVFKSSPKEFTEVAKYRVADTEPWSVPIVVGDRIYVKDNASLILWTIN